MIQGQASSHLQIRVILYHVELNTYSTFSRLNTRFTSPQTCHMLPLDHVKHKSNSGTIQTWILTFKTCSMQANIWNARSNATYKFMSLLPLLVCIFYSCLSYPLTMSFHLFAPPILLSLWISLPLCQQLAQKVSSNYR